MISLTQKPTLIQSVLSNFAETEVEIEEVSDSVAQTSKGSILLLDDDTFLLDMYSKRLKNEGYETIACNSADEALNILRSGTKVNLMLIDIIMPMMSGFEFMQTLRDENLDKDVIKIVLSNTSDQTQVIKQKLLKKGRHLVYQNLW